MIIHTIDGKQLDISENDYNVIVNILLAMSTFKNDDNRSCLVSLLPEEVKYNISRGKSIREDVKAILETTIEKGQMQAFLIHLRWCEKGTIQWIELEQFLKKLQA